MSKLNPDKIVVEAIKKLKNSEYGATAIKVELEVELRRDDYGVSCRDIYNKLAAKLEVHGLFKLKNYEWLVDGAMVYAKVYDDNSVDTEFTFTLSLADPKVVLLLPKIVQAFVDVCTDNSNDFETHKAGMHMAFLNNKKCVYPIDKLKAYDSVRFNNFRKSMIRLLPALYFLGSCDCTSRDLLYRKPQIERANNHHGYDPQSPKYSAVAFARGSVEFRVFETCYQRPAAILDNLVVMCNAMKFWTRAYTRNNVKPTPPIRFGIGYGSELRRMYFMPAHLDLLQAGLTILKPAYKTIKELKVERSFDISKTGLKNKIKDERKKAGISYRLYEKRFDWEVVYDEQCTIRREVNLYATGVKDPNTDITKGLEEIKKLAKQRRRKYQENKINRKAFIEDKMTRCIPSNGGEWTLREETVVSPNSPTPALSRHTLIDWNEPDFFGRNLAVEVEINNAN